MLKTGRISTGIRSFLLALLLGIFAAANVYADTVIIGTAPFIEDTSSAKAKESGLVAVDAKVEKPELASEGAVCYDATTGQFLFEKNPDSQLYPASITKVMTVLLAAEKLKTEDVISFSESTMKNLESGYTNVSMTTGDTMSAKDAMYAILLKSACEVSNAVAEKVSGTQNQFAQLMNQRAKQLGCTHTNFRNASGLNDNEHKTTAADMALITAAAFANETFRKIASTKSYTLPASKKRGSLTVTNSNKMLYSSNDEYFDGIVGGKTGYTSKAGNTLVEYAEVNGHKLVTVVMKSNGKQYSDTKKLLNYAKALLEENSQKSVTASKQIKTGWEDSAEGKKYILPDGKYAVSEWVDIDNGEYYFGSDGFMATGWKKFSNGAWYYFNPENGEMVHDKWVVMDDGKSYYLKSNGVLATNMVIDGKYRVDENGLYVEKVG